MEKATDWIILKVNAVDLGFFKNKQSENNLLENKTAKGILVTKIGVGMWKLI